MSNNLTNLALQQKVSLTLLAVMTVMVIVSYGILRTEIAPTFEQLEIAQARTNVVRAARSIQANLDNIDAIVYDWAAWDDAYTYGAR